MTQYKRPDEAVFASGAKPGELEAFPDIARGWGVAFEQTAGIPPMEWFNALFKRTDEAIRYLMQRGIAEWSATEDYPPGALVRSAGSLWSARQASTGQLPGSESVYWLEYGSNTIGTYTAVPTLLREPVIYVPPYGLMEWQSLQSGYRSQRCGEILLQAAPVAKAGTVKANGGTLSKKNYPGLWGWAMDTGMVVSAAAWAPGNLAYADLGGDSFRVPDLRGEFLRAFDDGRGVDAGRRFGQAQQATDIPVMTVARKESDPTTGVLVTPLLSAVTPDGNGMMPTNVDGFKSGVSGPYLAASLAAGGTTGVSTFTARPRNCALLAVIFV
ncbi:hypothetical protein APB27_01270 [Pseudomonas aeruginosa]|uniref:phage tail protein n=1 Tax=Pseudomonas aeruginosa group TaxID=136841 RepID=UPI00071BBF19|nr:MULTISPECIES: phage tail protein [Pseudomonas aeruginosa group]KSP93800.1 hypothetical protein APB27_01270 [Pseudomonas aeruginosa]MCW8022791.1 phage tail protein [Pseudomonas aeruginosa]RTT38783.1 hypothetical protein DY956_09340 [Pseudomonas paraeruginosa]